MKFIPYFFAFISLSLALPLLYDGHRLRMMHSTSSEDLQDDTKCNLCLDAAKLFQQVVEFNLPLDAVLPFVVDICREAIPSGGAYICPGIIQSYGPVVVYVMSNVLIEPRVICQDLHYCKKSAAKEAGPPNNESVMRLNPDIGHLLNKLKERLSYEDTHSSLLSVRNAQSFEHDKTLIQDVNVMKHEHITNTTPMKKEIKGENGLVRFLQLTDLHVDLQYAEGSPYDCGLYFCCRSWYNGTTKAGHYGEFSCDLPVATLDLLAETLQKLDPQPDFVIYTGDNAPHDVWNETWTTQLDASQFIVDYLAEKMPSMTIYPAIGNHESWPQSEYIGTMPEYQALNRDLAYKWQKWVDFPQDALDTIANSSCYSVKIMDKLRILSFNSDYGYSDNFYSYLNFMNNHYKSLIKWIEEQLQLAEKQGDKVLMIAHIPPGDLDSKSEYGEFYLNLTKRFRDTIVGHLFGHTHRDQFKLIQDADGVYGVVLIAPSATTFGHINPSFRIYTMDTSTMTLLGYEQYYLNVTLANELHARDPSNKPRFELSYTTAEDYGLKDLTPVQWTSLVARFETEPSLLNEYSFNIQGKSEPVKNCDDSCKKNILCSVTNVISSHYLSCLGS